METELSAGVSLMTRCFDQSGAAVFGFNFRAARLQAAKSFFKITWKENKGCVQRSWPRPQRIHKLPNKGKIWV